MARASAVRRLLVLGVVAGIVALAFVHLTQLPATWFDEGSHLHVPKTLVTFGKYADYSDGEFRYYGPTVGVGPTVMLPVALAFRVAGVGLLQARVVLALYLLLAIAAFVALARRLGGQGLAALAALLVLTSPSISLIETGRQVLGEVPGLFFLCAGLYFWFGSWERRDWTRLVGGAVLLGLASITKHVYLISILPGLAAAAALSLVYYRRLPIVVFAVPLVVVGGMFGAWQVVLIAGLGPGTAAANLHLLQDATRGAALVFSSENMRRAAAEVVSLRAVAGLVVPGLLYTGIRQCARDADERWTAVWLMAMANLAWYVVASAGWPRYAFPGLALSCLLVGRLAWDLVAPLRARLDEHGLASVLRSGAATLAGLAITATVVLVSVGALARTVIRIARPPAPFAQAMASYMDAHVPADRVVHSWDPEMSILSTRRFRFPPPSLLIVAVAHQWTGGPPVTDRFDFEAAGRPDYVLEGPFSRYVQLYPADRLQHDYRAVATEGGYVLYQRLGGN